MPTDSLDIIPPALEEEPAAPGSLAQQPKQDPIRPPPTSQGVEEPPNDQPGEDGPK